ncbi:MAG: hypothetical protein ACKO26_06960, partial [Planctomycetota bacterium]
MTRPLTALLITCVLAGGAARAGEWIDLLAGDPASVFQKVDPAWHAAKSVMIDPANPRKLVAEEGTGIFTNAPKGTARDIYTRKEFGDIALEIEFLIPQRSNSGVK